MTTYNVEKARTQKELVYSRLWPYSRKIKKYLTLPSETCGDIIYLMEQGAIDEDTEIVAFEVDPKKFKNVEAKIRSLKLRNVTLYKGNIQKYDFEIWQSHNERPFDLVYLDFCGEMTFEKSRFVNEMSPVLTECRVAATFCILFRYNEMRRSQFRYDNGRYHRDVHYSVPAEGYSYRGLSYEKMDEWHERASWTANQYFDALCYKVNGRKLDTFHIYSEKGYSAPMFFMAYTPKSAEKRNPKVTTQYMTAGQKAWATRRANAKK